MKVWRLIVWGVSPEHSGLMARLKMMPAKSKPTTFWREYPIEAKEQVEAAISLLKSCGLHGVAKRGKKQKSEKFRSRPTLAVSREGFGRKLNATPIAGSWRRKTRHR